MSAPRSRRDPGECRSRPTNDLANRLPASVMRRLTPGARSRSDALVSPRRHRPTAWRPALTGATLLILIWVPSYLFLSPTNPVVLASNAAITAFALLALRRRLGNPPR